MDLKKAQEYIKALKNGEKFPKKNMFLIMFLLEMCIRDRICRVKGSIRSSQELILCSDVIISAVIVSFLM